MMWVAGYFYAEKIKIEDGEAGTTTTTTTTTVYWSLVLVSAAWLISSVLFVTLMNRNYCHTFLSTMTGHDDVKDKFKNEDNSSFQRV